MKNLKFTSSRWIGVYVGWAAVIAEQHRDFFYTSNHSAPNIQSPLVSREHFTMATMLKVLTLIVPSASGLAAVIALMKPDLARVMSNAGRHSTSRCMLVLYSTWISIRTLPFCFQGPAIAWFLFTASAIQFTGVVIAVGKKDKGWSSVRLLEQPYTSFVGCQCLIRMDWVLVVVWLSWYDEIGIGEASQILGKFRYVTFFRSVGASRCRSPLQFVSRFLHDQSPKEANLLLLAVSKIYAALRHHRPRL